MVLYAGFDIGIKNLSFCIIDSDIWKEYLKNDENTDKNGILLWKNINLIEEEHNCEFTFLKGKNKNKICNNKAKYKDNETFLCGKHKNVNSKEIFSSKMKIQDIKIKCFNELNKIKLFDNVKYIFIENQPMFNHQMKMFSIALETYFLIRLNVNRFNLDVFDYTIIKFSPSKNKLSIYNGPQIDTSHIKNKYLKRKYLAIKHTEIFLKNSPIFLEENFLSIKKKDDLADSFLHCILNIK